MLRRLPRLESRSPATRAAVLLAFGAYAVHELRYVIAFGRASDTVVAGHVHSYMGAVVPIMGLLLAVGLGSWVAALARANRRGRGEAERHRLPAAWLAASGSLLTVFTVQESVEGLLAPGHPTGIVAILGGGGWTAVPLALVLGAAIALLLRGARAATRCAAACRIPCDLQYRVTAARPAPVWCGPAAGQRLPVIASNRAGRGPPRLS